MKPANRRSHFDDRMSLYANGFLEYASHAFPQSLIIAVAASHSSWSVLVSLSAVTPSPERLFSMHISLKRIVTGFERVPTA